MIPNEKGRNGCNRATPEKTLSTNTADYGTHLRAAALDFGTLPVALTVYASASSPLSKTYRRTDDGRIEKKAAAHMTAGTARLVELPFSGLGDLFDSLGPDEATGYGLFDAAQARIVVDKKAKPPALLARTKEFCRYRARPGVLMLDHDPHPRGASMRPAELLAALAALVPGSADAAYLVRASVSAGVRIVGQEPAPASGGYHLFMPVIDASDIPRFGAVLFRRLWLAGHGYIALARNGALLVRTCIDGAVFAGERLDFTGRPVIGDGLEWTPPAAEYRNGGYLDTAALPDLSDAENAAYDALVAAAKTAAQPDADKQHADWLGEHGASMRAAGVPEDRINARLASMRPGTTVDIHADWPLHFANAKLGIVTAGDVLADLARFDGEALADPVEGPAYGVSTARFYANLPDGRPVINSMAHGGALYFLSSPAHDTAAPESRKRNNVHNVHNVHSDPTDASTDPTADALATCEAALAAAVDDPGVLASDGFVEASRLLREGAPEDWFRIRARLKAVAQGVGLKLGDIESMSAPAGDTANESEIADELVALVQEKADLFHAPDDTCYAALTDGPPACYRLDTKAFAKWLGYAYYTSTTTKDHPGRAASDTAMRTAVVVLSGIATNEGDERPVYLRAAQHGGAYYIDLGTDDWSAVEVTPAGWRITARPPVQFWRSNTARPLPMPHAGGDLSRLWQYANVPAEQRPLVLAVLLEALRPETPFPILELIGQQGTAKSSTQARLRRLVDPNAVDLRAAPKSVEDLFVSAGANWVTSLNNLSHMSSQVQDALCNLATGGGFAGRTLYTNADETLIEAKRPVFINGIVPLVTAQDLTDRVVHIELPELAAYRPERELDAGFDADAPAIFGGLLDLFVATLAELPRVKLDRPPRMADFAALGEAMMRAEGNDPGAFVSLYSANRRESVARSLESSPVACAIRRLVDESSDTGTAAWPRDGGPGTVEHLLTRLSDYREGADAWPRSARGLGDALRRQRPALAQIGIGIEFGRTSRGITVTIRRLPAEPVHVVHVVHVDPLSTLPARGVTPAFHHCATCQHLDGNHCRSRNEFIEHPSVGSCKRWEARGRIVRSEVRS